MYIRDYQGIFPTKMASTVPRSSFVTGTGRREMLHPVSGVQEDFSARFVNSWGIRGGTVSSNAVLQMSSVFPHLPGEGC